MVLNINFRATAFLTILGVIGWKAVDKFIEAKSIGYEPLFIFFVFLLGIYLVMFK